MFCVNCGKPLSADMKFCPECGQSAGDAQPPAVSRQTTRADKNPFAISGIVCSSVGLMLPIPVVDMLVSLAGTALSIAGVRRTRLRGLAVAGIVIGALGAVGALVMLLTNPGAYSDIWELISGSVAPKHN
jgi:hypothetical protein